MDRDELLQRITDAGVVGAGGGGFPAGVKLAGEFIHYIANGAECEPLLHKDIELMKHYPDVIANTMRIIGDTLAVDNIYFAAKEKYSQVWESINPSLEKNNIIPKYLEDIFPAGDEFDLVETVLGKVIPPANIPLTVQTAVNNVETIYNIGRALDDIPVTHKWLTVTGDVVRPFTAVVPIGTTAEYLLELARPKIKNYCIIEGGPMMGNLVQPDEPVKKTTSGFIVVAPEHPLITYRKMSIQYALRIAASVCMQCRACTDLCPRYLLGHPLEPHRIMRASAMPLSLPLNVMTAALLCSECGVCEQFACPMGLSPRKINAELKINFGEQGVKFQWNGDEIAPREEREFRRIPSQRLAERLGILDYINIHPEFIPSISAPERVIIRLKQHTGVPAEPIVKIGNKVEIGQEIARIPNGKDKLGANIHSSINGTITSIQPDIIIESGEE